MLEETILLKPELDKGGLQKMFNDLNKRFSNVAKAFGKGMTLAMRAAPFLAIASLIASKLSSPLEKAEAIIDRLLGKSGDLTDSSEELGTTPGALARLETAFAKKGVNSETARMMLGRYQTAVAEEQQAMKNDPKAKPGLLRNFVGETDMAEGLFSLLQSMKDMPADDRVVAFNSIFGQKMKGKVQAIVNEKNMGGLLEDIPSVEVFNAAIKRLDDLGDKLDAGKALNEARNLIRQAPNVQEVMIDNILQEQKRQMDNEAKALKAYVSQQALYQAAMQIIDKLSKFVDDVVNKFAPDIIKALNLVATAVSAMLPIATRIIDWLDTTGKEMLNYMRNFSSNISNDFKTFFTNFKSITMGGGGQKK